MNRPINPIFTKNGLLSNVVVALVVVVLAIVVALKTIDAIILIFSLEEFVRIV